MNERMMEFQNKVITVKNQKLSVGSLVLTLLLSQGGGFGLNKKHKNIHFIGFICSGTLRCYSWLLLVLSARLYEFKGFCTV